MTWEVARPVVTLPLNEPRFIRFTREEGMYLPECHISEGNTKLRNIPVISLTPKATCLGCRAGEAEVPCGQTCYAVKAYRQYDNVRIAWDDNAVLAFRSPGTLMGRVVRWLEDHSGNGKRSRFGKRFRWHGAGDIVSRAYLDGMIWVAKQFPDRRFLCFSKMWVRGWFPPVETLPSNLKLFASMWSGWYPGVKLPEGYPVAWMQDGMETRIPRDTFVCPGDCGNCDTCWDGVPVVFPKH